MHDSQTYHLSISRCLNEGWEYFKKHPGLIIGTFIGIEFILLAVVACVILFQLATGNLSGSIVSTLAGNAIFLFLLPPMSFGIYRFFLNAARDSSPDFTDIFFGFRRYLTVMGTYFSLLIAVAILLTPTILWMIYFASELTDKSALGPRVVPAAFFMLPIVAIFNMLLVFVVLARYFVIHFVIMDDPKIGVIDAIRRTHAITEGNSWRLIGFFFVSGLIIFGLMILLIIPAITIGLFVWVAYARAYLNLKEAHDASVTAPETVTTSI